MVDKDSNNEDDLVDKIYIQYSSLYVSPNYTTTRTYNGTKGSGAITLQFRVICQNNYYGDNCNIYCLPTDNSTLGHYTCGDTGIKYCNNGWRNSSNDCLTGKVQLSFNCNLIIYLLATCSEGCSSVGGMCSIPGECKYECYLSYTNLLTFISCKTGWSGSNCTQCTKRVGCGKHPLIFDISIISHL